MLKVVLDDIMNEHIIKVQEHFTVGSVAHLLMRYRINGILVMADDDDSKLVGILTTTDLLRLLDEAMTKGSHRVKHLIAIAEKKVGEVCSRHIIGLKKSDKATKAIALMHKHNVHTIPVFEKGKLVGVIGRHDLLNVAFGM